MRHPVHFHVRKQSDYRQTTMNMTDKPITLILLLKLLCQPEIKYDFSELADSGNSIEIFPLRFLMIMIMMGVFFQIPGRD